MNRPSENQITNENHLSCSLTFSNGLFTRIQKYIFGMEYDDFANEDILYKVCNTSERYPGIYYTVVMRLFDVVFRYLNRKLDLSLAKFKLKSTLNSIKRLE